MIEQIYKIVKDNANHVDDLEMFVKDLTECYAKHFGVKNCKVVIDDESTFSEHLRNSIHKTAPAFYRGKEETIHFRRDVVGCGDMARLIKLSAHEWMHYLAHLAYRGLIAYKDIDPKYRKLVIEENTRIAARVYNKLHQEVAAHFENKDKAKYFWGYEKLSAQEVVCDKFAQTILKELKSIVEDKVLLAQIDVQIEDHNKQIEECQKAIAMFPEIDKFVRDYEARRMPELLQKRCEI